MSLKKTCRKLGVSFGAYLADRLSEKNQIPPLVELIRRTPRLAGTPVVIATPVTAEVVAEASEAGVSTFLPRPFGAQSLEEVLRLFIGRRAEQEVRAATTCVS